MARAIRFHLDECCDNAVASGLRRRNLDVTTTPELGFKGVGDEQQLAYGLAANRVIVTHDADFLRFHAAGVPHVGIAYCDKDTLSIGEVISRLVLIWELYEPEEMVNRVEFLKPHLKAA
jgi:predicted nuclease of predicted toxin-antitoxin system